MNDEKFNAPAYGMILKMAFDTTESADIGSVPPWADVLARADEMYAAYISHIKEMYGYTNQSDSKPSPAASADGKTCPECGRGTLNDSFTKKGQKVTKCSESRRVKDDSTGEWIDVGSCSYTKWGPKVG